MMAQVKIESFRIGLNGMILRFAGRQGKRDEALRQGCVPLFPPSAA
jgi:hypothetical protein